MIKDYGFFHDYPYTNFHEMNLDWILAQMIELRSDMKNFVNQNTIKYADPIQWNITTQYEANTVVIEPNSGNAYISNQPVPAGVAITDTEYWSVIGNFSLLYDSIKHSIAEADDENNIFATEARTEGQLLWLNSKLYKVLSDLAQGTMYITSGVSQNVQEVTVEDLLQAQDEHIEDLFTQQMGYINESLNVMSSSISAMGNHFENEIDGIDARVGSLSDLETPDKTSIVNAINSSISEAIKGQTFHKPEEYGAVGDGVTDDTEAFRQLFANENLIAIPEKLYIVSGGITLRSYQYITGAGVIRNTSETSNIFYGEDLDYVTIENIIFGGGTKTMTSHSTLYGDIHIEGGNHITIKNTHHINMNKVAGILFNRVSNFVIDGTEHKNSGYCAIMLYGQCYYGNIYNNVIQVSNYTGYPNTYGIACSCSHLTESPNKNYECRNINIEGNLVYTGLGHWEGIDTHAGDYINIQNNRVIGFYSGITCIRYNDWNTQENGSPTHINITNNYIKGPSSLSGTHDECFGIRVAGNKEVYLDCEISNNTIEYMIKTTGNTQKGSGIFFSGNAAAITDNIFTNSVKYCIDLMTAGVVNVSGNKAFYLSTGNMLYFRTVNHAIMVKDNSLSNGDNFYVFGNNTGLSDIIHKNNEIINAYWINNSATPSGSDIADFVPDYIGGTPTGSSYHPKGVVARNANPANGQPEAWIATGSGWVKTANLVTA